MSDTGKRIDALAVYLTGGVSNTDPDLSLGGFASSKLVRGMGGFITSPLPSILVRNVHNQAEGEAVLQINTSNELLFTPAGGAVGDPVTIAEGQSKVVYGEDRVSGVVVTREAGYGFSQAISQILCRNPMNGVLGQKNVTNAQRVAGVTTYRAVMLTNQGVSNLDFFRTWTPSGGGTQATWSLGYETPDSNGAIQTIADELSAPTGISWVTSTTEGGALSLPSLAPGESLGLWIRKVFPAAGAMAQREDVQLALKWQGI